MDLRNEVDELQAKPEALHPEQEELIARLEDEVAQLMKDAESHDKKHLMH